MSKISVVQDVGCSAREKRTTKERSKSFHSRLWWTERRRREERGERRRREVERRRGEDGKEV
jgi:hypothetical protein